MALPVSTLPDWLARHREKLIDAALLAFALNCSGLPSGTPPPSFGAQLMVLAVFAALAAPRAHEVPALWSRYLKLLPGYLVAGVAGAGLLVWWFGQPRAVAWFVPVWLAFTVLARLPLTDPVRRTAANLRDRRLDVLGADLAWVAAFTFAVPRLAGLPAPSLGFLGALLAGWIAWHWIRGGHDPARAGYRRNRWAAAGLAVAWGLAWWPVAGAWPALVFTAWLAAGLVLTRLAVLRFAAAPTEGCVEVLRWLGLAAVAALLFHPFANANARGTDDARYYATFLADALTQFRHGVFPVFVGQSEYQFNGSVIPIRIAPGFQYLGGLLDLLTGRTLAPLAVQNLLVALVAPASAASAYLCLRRVPAPAPLAWFLAVLFVTCPGVVGLVFISELYLSWLTVPWIPVVIWLGCRSYTEENPRWFAALGFSLGVTWWLHSPIALWLTAAAGILQVARLIWRRPALRLLPAQLGAGAAAFLLTAAYPVVSAALYPADPGAAAGGFAVHAAHMLPPLLDAFPAAWLPLSALGRQLGDFQVGYGLLAVGLLVLPAAWRTRRIELRVLIFTVAACLLLLVPLVPRLTLQLWELVPAAVRGITNTWAMQRLYVLIAGCLVFLAGATLAATRPGAWWRWVLVIACGWSTAESIKFLRGSRAISDPQQRAANFLRPENTILTRYSYGLFARRPAWFTHGVTDPALENRLLAADLRTVVAGNYLAAAGLARAGVTTDHMLTRDQGRLVLHPALTLRPGHRYMAEFTAALEPFPVTTLVLKGATFDRLYSLPEYGDARSFGLGGEHPSSVPLATTASAAEVVGAEFIPPDPATAPALEGRLRVRLGEYDPAALPVRVRSWMPYTATVQSPGALWLETPRMHQPGYVATVDDRPAEVRRSAEGLASVAVPAGRSEVVLRYVAPAGLAAAFWISLVALIAGAGAGLLAAGRTLKGAPVAPATPAGSAR